MTLEQITKLALKAGLFVPAAGIPEDGALMRFAHLVTKQARSEPPTNQCGETCERAKLCAICLSQL